MKLLFDQNLSAKLCGLLEDVCAGSQHVRVPLGLHESADEVIWTYALEHGFVIVSKDDDFRQLSAVRGAPPKALCLDIGNTPTDFVAALLRRNLESIAQVRCRFRSGAAGADSRSRVTAETFEAA